MRSARPKGASEARSAAVMEVSNPSATPAPAPSIGRDFARGRSSSRPCCRWAALPDAAARRMRRAVSSPCTSGRMTSSTRIVAISSSVASTTFATPRHVGIAGRYPPEGRLRTPRARHHRDHPGHLLSRDPGNAGGGGGADHGDGVRDVGSRAPGPLRPRRQQRSHQARISGVAYGAPDSTKRSMPEQSSSTQGSSPPPQPSWPEGTATMSPGPHSRTSTTPRRGSPRSRAGRRRIPSPRPPPRSASRP